MPPVGNKRIRSKREAFVKLVTENIDKVWYICSHDNPDPDSLSSAMGMQRILGFLGVEHAQIVYCGEISHPQNRAMVNVLDIRVNRWDEIQDEVKANSDAMFIFVDCTVNQKNVSIGVKPNIVVDHHKISTSSHKDILFIHDEVGACATLILDLALSMTDGYRSPDDETSDVNRQSDSCLDLTEDSAKDLITALTIGIKTDTMDFLSETTTDEDIQAFLLLAKHLSDDKFHSVVHYEYPPYALDCESIAWNSKRADYLPHLITEIGFIDETKSDCIPAIADKFMRILGVQTVIVYAIVGKSIRASIRTSSASLDCKTLIDDVFGKGSGGSKGGAKGGIGGANVSFNVFDPATMSEADRETLRVLLRSQIERKFLAATTK